MSRVGKKTITIPKTVTADIKDGFIKIKGPKGELQTVYPKTVIIQKQEDELAVRVKDEQRKRDRSMWGTYRSLIDNMVIGVTEGFQKQLELNGVGFRAQTQGKTLVLNLGFSHPVEIPFPEGIDMSVEKNIITIAGIDKQLVGETAARIRALKKAEPYKGKGIKYVDEVIRRKAGKVVKSSEG